ncbi:MAG: hypothetical protein M3512_15490 [Bacteroidota bacterium]|nr:hypothetical protein [Bacteroidota bacterium]
MDCKAPYKIKIRTKKLQSGMMQVKFYTNNSKNKELYGYLLVESKTTLKDVVSGIQEKLSEIDYLHDYYHNHLYTIGKNRLGNNKFLIFDA